jgi:hypothetical protein
MIEPVAQRALDQPRRLRRLVSFSFVWPWNCGSRRNSRQLRRERGPARTSSAVICAALPVVALLAPGPQAPSAAPTRNPADGVLPPCAVGTVLQ